MTDEPAKHPTTDLLAAMRTETPNDETEGTDAPSTDSEVDDGAKTKGKEPAHRHNPHA